MMHMVRRVSILSVLPGKNRTHASQALGAVVTSDKRRVQDAGRPGQDVNTTPCSPHVLESVAQVHGPLSRVQRTVPSARAPRSTVPDPRVMWHRRYVMGSGTKPYGNHVANVRRHVANAAIRCSG